MKRMGPRRIRPSGPFKYGYRQRWSGGIRQSRGGGCQIPLWVIIVIILIAVVTEGG